MQEEIAGCFSSAEKTGDVDPTAVTKSGHNVFVSAYVANLSDHRRLITVTWCKNLLVHGLSVTVSGSDEHHTCKVEIKPWHFWKKQGTKQFLLDRPVDVFWDLRVAKFNGEAEPASDYYVAVVSDGEVALLLGNMKDEAYRKTGCRPALVDPVLAWRKEHVFGKRRFGTRARFHDKGGLHEISIEIINGGGSDDHEMEIRIDGHVVVHVRRLQWKFRGNECVRLSRGRIEVYYDVLSLTNTSSTSKHIGSLPSLMSLSLFICGCLYLLCPFTFKTSTIQACRLRNTLFRLVGSIASYECITLVTSSSTL